MAAEIVALAVAGSRVVRVAGAHDSHLVGVVPAAVLHRQAVLPGLADVAAVDFGSPLHPAQKSSSVTRSRRTRRWEKAAGVVSEVPLSWWISVSGSLFTRSCAQAASIGRFLLSTSSGNIMPSLRLALCEIASNSLPALRWLSIQFQRSSG